jgi:hypothetical protein
MRWVTKEELRALEFPAADRDVLGVLGVLTNL